MSAPVINLKDAKANRAMGLPLTAPPRVIVDIDLGPLWPERDPLRTPATPNK